MNRFCQALVIAFLTLSSPTVGNDPKPPPAKGPTAEQPPPLSDRHRLWLDQKVVYVISDEERAGFLSAADEKTRDELIVAFWEARDPTPGTELNEARVRHEKSVAEANELFGNKMKPGWRTERGRIYTPLGPPRGRTRYSDNRVYPIELWPYQGNLPAMLPAALNLLFYKPYGAGDWELYDPLTAGPEKLVAANQFGRRLSASAAAPALLAGDEGAGGESAEEESFAVTDPRATRQRALIVLREVSPELERAANSPDPTVGIGRTSAWISLAAVNVARAIHDYPNAQEIDRSYVARVLEGKPKVELDYSFHAVGMRSHFHGGFGPGGGLLHYVIEIPPGSLSLQRYGDQTSGSLEVVGRVFDRTDGSAVLGVDERIEFAFDDQQLARIRSHPLAFLDLLPLRPGSYEAHFLVRNRLSKDIGLLDFKFDIPSRWADGIALGQPIIMRQSRPADAALSADSADSAESADLAGSMRRPFVFGDRSYLPAIDGVLPVGSPLEAVYEVVYPVTDRTARGHLDVRYSIRSTAGQVVKSGSARVATDPATDHGVAVGTLRQPLDGLQPGTYVLAIEIESGRERVSRTTKLEIRADSRPHTPWLWMQQRDTRPTSLALAIAEQHFTFEEDDAALRALENGALYASAEERGEAQLQIAQLRLERGEFAAALELIEPLAAEPEVGLQTLLILGLARSGNGDSAGAVSALERASGIAPDDPDILNLLGEEWYQAGNEARALTAFERSLALDPLQATIRQLVEDLR